MNPLEQIDLGTDPAVTEFVHKSLSRKYGDCEPPPELSTDQLLAVDELSKRIRETVAGATVAEIVEYLENKLTIIAGPFGGATTHAADLLTRLGVPCGHELLMREGGLFIDSLVAGADIRAECSGDALRWINMVPGCPLIHLIRHPLKQCNSFFRLRAGSISITDCVGYTMNYHLQVYYRKPDLVWRVERPEDLMPVLKHFRTEPPMGRIDQLRQEAKKNTHTKKQDKDLILWEHFPKSLQQFCEEYGYRKDGTTILDDEACW